MLLPQPRRPAEPGPCTACEHGCGCPPTGPGCPHYGCHGTNPTHTCPGVIVEEDRYEAACRQRRAEEARRLNQRAQWGAIYRTLVIETLTQLGGPR